MTRTTGTYDDNGPALVDKDRRAGLEMIDEVEAHLDLSKITTESEFLMQHLTDRYEELLAPALVPDAATSAEQMQRAMRVLVRQLARAQADIFALKSAVLGRDRLVITQDWTYSDPVRAHARALGEDLRQTAPLSFGKYAIMPDDKVIGFGWYHSEEKDGVVWRWSGPAMKSGLFLPNVASGKCLMNIEFTVLTDEVVPQSGFISLNGDDVECDVSWRTNTRAVVTFTADPGEDAANFLVEFNLAKTVSPAALMGKSDTRELGICLRNIVYEPV